MRFFEQSSSQYQEYRRSGMNFRYSGSVNHNNDSDAVEQVFYTSHSDDTSVSNDNVVETVVFNEYDDTGLDFMPSTTTRTSSNDGYHQIANNDPFQCLDAIIGSPPKKLTRKPSELLAKSLFFVTKQMILWIRSKHTPQDKIAAEYRKL